jgi:hypothetical protein
MSGTVQVDIEGSETTLDLLHGGSTFQGSPGKHSQPPSQFDAMARGGPEVCFSGTGDTDSVAYASHCTGNGRLSADGRPTLRPLLRLWTGP